MVSSKQIDGFYRQSACDLNEFKALVEQELSAETVPNATHVQSNIPIYSAASLRNMLEDTSKRRSLLSEWASVLQNTAGVLVIKGAAENIAAIDEATQIFESIISAERSSGNGGDHFAAAGANDRIWNSLQKLCLADPSVFARYFANPLIDAVCESWLGPNYQMTTQVNLVHPGGAAQQAHRDYHLGFQTAEVCEDYPAHVHHLSPYMTLQGAIAHCDMSLESGPTKLLPFSQKYLPGYVAWRRDDFREYFEANYVQLPLEKGDAVFFNPALFHAAGANTTTDIHRMVNLLQVSSAFGRAMESVDRSAMCSKVFPALKHLTEQGVLSGKHLDAAIASCGEGYSFPTNLDLDPPVGGLAPETQQMLLKRALNEGMAADVFTKELQKQSARRLP